ncbi:MAG: nucleotidyltransferase domain-containing protein [Alphaproteobacteria bacterium]|nr:nucleotidyltransferase domain-containing protein [Alphaproteobacteria bacterium]
MATYDPTLKRFRATLDGVYGSRVERAVLYGSRARGDARPDSDYDIAVFLRGYADFGREAGTLAEIETTLLNETGAIINSLPFPEKAWQSQTGLMQEIRREGIEI